MKYTPGPWKRDIAQIDKSWLKGRLQEAVVSDAGVIALCSDNSANAALICAAPDLLEELEFLVAFNRNYPEATARARAAIARAKGGE